MSCDDDLMGEGSLLLLPLLHTSFPPPTTTTTTTTSRFTGGNWLLGGEVELLGRVRYNDGLDQYRLTAKELVDEFVRRGADAVFAFQTRNPTHAGHAYLMRTAREKLLKKGW